MFDALLMRLTPSGALSRSVTKEKSPVQKVTPWDRNHSLRAWSLTLSAMALVFGFGQSSCVIQNARATKTRAAATSKAAGVSNQPSSRRKADRPAAQRAMSLVAGLSAVTERG